MNLSDTVDPSRPRVRPDLLLKWATTSGRPPRARAPAVGASLSWRGGQTAPGAASEPMRDLRLPLHPFKKRSITNDQGDTLPDVQ